MPGTDTSGKGKEMAMFRLVRLLVASMVVVGLAGSAVAQDMTSADVQRLQQNVDQISGELAKVRQRDRVAARNFQAELLDLEEEVTYLKVKLRKERSVARAEYVDVRDRLEDLRSRVNGNEGGTGRYSTGGGTTATSDAPRVNAAAPGTLPVGTELDLRLQTPLSSSTSQVEDRFEATTAVDVRQDGKVIIPAGSRVRGVVTAVRAAGRVERKGSLSLSFDQITVNGRNYPIRGTVTEALESGGYREDADKIGTGAAVGGIIGGILGGFKGALAGILIGGGGVVAATEGENVQLAPGTVLRMRLDQPLNVTR
jgi:ATP-dependent protease HslVU (ClpYQ) peptidase subunit